MLTRREAIATGAGLLASALPSRAVGQTALATSPRREGRLRLGSGRCLSYRVYGQAEGPLVFYLHGTPGSRYELGLCENECAEAGLRVIAVDRPGMGRSSYQGNRRITDWPGDLEQLAMALAPAGSRFGIIGLSGGAPYAAACAHQIPHRLTHVAIVSGHAPLGAAGTCPGNQDPLIELVARRPRLGKMAFQVVGRRLDRKPDRVLEKISKNWTAADRKLMLCNSKNRRNLILNLREASHCGPAGLVHDIRLLAGCWGFALREISGAAISIWQGGCDPVAPPSMGAYFHRQLAGSQLTVDPRAGHVTMWKWHAPEILALFSRAAS